MVCFSLYQGALWNRRMWLVLLQHLWFSHCSHVLNSPGPGAGILGAGIQLLLQRSVAVKASAK